MRRFAEGDVELALLDWLAELGYAVINGARIAPGEEEAEREEFGEVVLSRRLREALARLNPALPQEALEDAFRKVTRPQSPSLVANNRAFHRMLVDGVPVEYPHEGRIVGDKVWLVDFAHPDNNDWLAVNQFTIIENVKARSTRANRSVRAWMRGGTKPSNSM
jgi:type I restriction enzyme R subunit